MLALLLVAGLGLEAEVGKLADPAPDVRAAARRVLLAAGSRAVPALRAGLDAPDVEVRRAAATLLDQLVRRELREGRRNTAYKIPNNKQVTQLRGMGRHPALRDRVLESGAVRHFRAAYRGILNQWHDPSLADYNGLLVALKGYVANTTRAAHGVDVLDNLLAAAAILWKLDQIGTKLPRGEWTTLWIVRRDVLPALHVTITKRGNRITRSEVEFYLDTLRYLKPLCDDVAEVKRTELVARLSKIGGK